MGKVDEATGIVESPSAPVIPLKEAFTQLPIVLEAGLRIMDLPRQVTPGVVPEGQDQVYWKVDNGLDPAYEVDFLEGVILGMAYGRSAFPYAFRAGPPGPASCQSWDGRTGYGDPGGDCSTCPLTAPEYEPRRNDPRCSPRAWMVFQQTGQMLPTLLIVPVTSIDVLRQFQLSLLAIRGQQPWDMVVRLRLTVHTTVNGARVARILPRPTADKPQLSAKQGKALNDLVMSDLRASIEHGQDVTQVVRTPAGDVETPPAAKARANGRRAPVDSEGLVD